MTCPGLLASIGGPPRLGPRAPGPYACALSPPLSPPFASPASIPRPFRTWPRLAASRDHAPRSSSGSGGRSRGRCRGRCGAQSPSVMLTLSRPWVASSALAPVPAPARGPRPRLSSEGRPGQRL
uniref:Uncharacterized protein LOC110221454 n=1 Tax=Phascolarctos cinereus TaxID=38626 RepID=A0A6P5LT88_PHACI|nr:uncharacterized protein LOC110221454 [Phascolarctos cinereus]